MSYEELLEHLVKSDDRTIVMTAENRAAIRNLPARIGTRFIDVGICEQTMIGMAAGLALCGHIPVVHALASFVTMRAFEFVRTDVGIANLPVKIVGGVAGFLSEANGPTHQAIEDVSIMRGIPNMGVFCPADEEDMMIGLPHILTSPQPFYIRYTTAKAVTRHSRDFTIGAVEQFGEEGDVTILTYGVLLRQAFIAAEILTNVGFSTSIVNIRTLKPVDEEMLLIAALRARLVVTLEDHFMTGGLFSILSELLTKNAAQANVLALNLNEHWFKPALLQDVLEYEGFTGEAIAQRIINKLELTPNTHQWLTLSH